MITYQKVRSMCKDFVLITIITFVLFIFLEGVSSLINAVIKFQESQFIAERLHTEYDPLLGWINKPNVYIQDMYGVDKYLKTNSQRFRNNQDVAAKIPDGISRWICSGDSFTLGYGVDNDSTWCSLLTSAILNTQTINMGQGGYGIDQAYLWYMRDGVKVEHDVLVFAFITGDVYRMAHDKFNGYPKPRLVFRNGEIVNQNFPVPELQFFDKYFPKYQLLILEFSLVSLVNETRERLRGSLPMLDQGLKPLKHEELVELSLSIFDKLHTFNKNNHRSVVFVLLPTQADFRGSPQEDKMRKEFQSKAEAKDWMYIDLVQDMRKLDSEDFMKLFIQEDIEGFFGSSGHYTEKGNQFIADKIAEHWSLVKSREQRVVKAKQGE